MAKRLCFFVSSSKCYNTDIVYDNLKPVIISFQTKAGQIGSGNEPLFRAMKEPNNSPFPKLDSIIQKMPDSERIKFSARFTGIIPASAQSFERAYVDHFWEACVEVLGWGWLKERYPSHYPKFNHPKSPDLLVKDKADQVIAAMECKKIRTSDEDRDYYKHKQGKTQETKDGLTSSNCDENPFLRKLVDTLSRAEKQISHSNAPNKFIFLDLTFDTPLMFPVLKEPTICAILRIASELCKNGIRLVSFERFQVEKPITGGGLH